MRTKSITLAYSLTQTEIFPPPQKDLERKDAWLKEIQSTIEADWKPIVIKVVYTIHNPEVEKLRKFFHTAVKYYAIQNMDLTDREETPHEFRQYREEILDEMLGYDYQTAHKVLRKRKSTSDFKEVQAWVNFLDTLKETLFEAAGYEFPVSEDFWERVKVVGYDKAQGEFIKALQKKMKGRV